MDKDNAETHRKLCITSALPNLPSPTRDSHPHRMIVGRANIAPTTSPIINIAIIRMIIVSKDMCDLLLLFAHLFHQVPDSLVFAISYLFTGVNVFLRIVYPSARLNTSVKELIVTTYL